MFYTWIISFLCLTKLISFSSHIVMKKKKLCSTLPHSCLKAKQLWNKFRQYLSHFINIPHSSPQSSIVVILDNNQHWMLISHLLLIFKFYIYSARNTRQLNFNNLKRTIKKNKIKELKKELTGCNKLKLLKEWCPVDHIIDWCFFQNKREWTTGAINFISRLYLFVSLFVYFSLFSLYLSVLFIYEE